MAGDPGEILGRDGNRLELRKWDLSIEVMGFIVVKMRRTLGQLD